MIHILHVLTVQLQSIWNRPSWICHLSAYTYHISLSPSPSPLPLPLPLPPPSLSFSSPSPSPSLPLPLPLPLLSLSLSLPPSLSLSSPSLSLSSPSPSPLSLSLSSLSSSLSLLPFQKGQDDMCLGVRAFKYLWLTALSVHPYTHTSYVSMRVTVLFNWTKWSFPNGRRVF